MCIFVSNIHINMAVFPPTCVCVCVFICTNLEQAAPAVEADRPQGEGAREGCTDFSHYIRP